MDQAGTRSQLPLLVMAAGTLLLLLFGTGLLSDIPSPAIGAIVAVAVLKLINVAEFRHLWQLSRFEFAVGATCFAGVLFIGPLAGIVLAFDWTGAALASALMAFPLMVRPIRLAIEAIDVEVDEVAVTLGAGAVTRFVRLTAPLAAPGLVAGALLGFAKALGEFGATITFVGAIPGRTLTLPTAIYQAVQAPGGEAKAIALCVVSAILAFAAVLAADSVGRWAAAQART